jgi:hypothetical protein
VNSLVCPFNFLVLILSCLINILWSIDLYKSLFVITFFLKEKLLKGIIFSNNVQTGVKKCAADFAEAVKVCSRLQFCESYVLNATFEHPRELTNFNHNYTGVKRFGSVQYTSFKHIWHILVALMFSYVCRSC